MLILVSLGVGVLWPHRSVESMVEFLPGVLGCMSEIHNVWADQESEKLELEAGWVNLLKAHPLVTHFFRLVPASQNSNTK